MSRKLWKRWLWTGALAAAALPTGALVAQDEQDNQDDPRAPAPAAQAVLPPQFVPARLKVQLAGETGQPVDALVAVAQAEAPLASEYWIGVGLDSNLPPLVKEQLGIEHGLVVLDPYPDSPAAKAGIKPNDILTRAGEKTLLKEPADLIKAVDEAKETEMTLTLLRGGKELTIQVTPTKRPQPEAQELRLKIDPNSPQLKEEIKRLEEVLQNLKSKAGVDGSLGFFFAHPPVVARADVFKMAEFPKDLRVQITKEGDGPATIKVKRGDKEWEVTEDKLGDLPDDVRMHVEMLRGRAGMRFPMTAPNAAPSPRALRVTSDGKIEGEIQVTPTPAVAVPPGQAYRAWAYSAGGGNVETKLDAILKKLDHMESKALEELQNEVQQLRKDLDEVRGKSPGESK